MEQKDERVINVLLKQEHIPRMVKVRQRFESGRIDCPAAVLREQLHRQEIRSTIHPGMSVAITAGSRGIENIPLILKETADFLKELGAEPFIIPAMGSHGGGTASGQVELLKSLGITQESTGCPIRASMEVDVLTRLEDGTPVYIDRFAHEADGVVVVNRIKPHTGFRGSYESGLFKMMTIGLGKHKGAEMIHGRGRSRMGESIRLCGNAHLDYGNILFGVGILENAFDHTYRLMALTRQEIREKEPEYLKEARGLMPRIIPQNLDVLIVDYMGKNISGAGMDTNITKSYSYGYGISREGRAKRLAVLDLTPESHGSAAGVGSADMITRRLFEKIDFDATYINLLASGGLESAKIPMVFDNQCRAIQGAIKTAAGADKENIRMVRIRDTLHLEEIWISEALLPEARDNPELEILGEPREMVFDSEGNLF